jgi:hypothetical protein
MARPGFPDKSAHRLVIRRVIHDQHAQGGKSVSPATICHVMQVEEVVQGG